MRGFGASREQIVHKCRQPEIVWRTLSIWCALHDSNVRPPGS